MANDEPSNDESSPRERLEQLDRAVKQALDRREAARRQDEEREARAQATRRGGTAWRVMINLVASTGLLAAAGYGLDVWIGSGPWGLLAGLFIGFAAGMYMAAQAASRVQAGDKTKPPE